MAERFTQQISLAGSYRPIIIQSVVVVVFTGFLGAALVGMLWQDSPVALRWLIGLAAAAAMTALFVLLRTRQLKRAATTGTLEVDAQGLVARYGGTVRTLAWQHVERCDAIRRPVKAAALTDSVGGRIVIGAVNAAARATAPTSPGVIGVGGWQDGPETDPHGRELAGLSAQLFGPAPAGTGVHVPIWFDDYVDADGGPATARLLELVRQHRPDLLDGRQ